MTEHQWVFSGSENVELADFLCEVQGSGSEDFMNFAEMVFHQMDILGLILTVLMYVLIGFGFAAGFALWRKVSAKWNKKKGKSGVRRGGWI